MKHLLALGTLLVLALLLTPGSGPSSAQEMAKNKAEEKPEWKSVSPGVWKTDLGEGQPEIAILRLSDDDYKELVKNPKSFLDSRHVFRHKLNKAEAVGDDPPPTGGGWIVIATHTPNSTSSYVAWPAPNQP